MPKPVMEKGAAEIQMLIMRTGGRGGEGGAKQR